MDDTRSQPSRVVPREHQRDVQPQACSDAPIVLWCPLTDNCRLYVLAAALLFSGAGVEAHTSLLDFSADGDQASFPPFLFGDLRPPLGRNLICAVQACMTL